MEKSCDKCRHFELDDHEYPCIQCRNNYKNKEVLWQPNDSKVAAVDMVNRPPHYTHGKYECIDVMVDTLGKEAVQHFCVLNAFKYVWRSKHKNGLEDIKKAWWYLDKYLQLEGNVNEQSN
jgi:hypothetical protein